MTIYLHQASGNDCKADLVFSKTRLAPQKSTTNTATGTIRGTDWNMRTEICSKGVTLNYFIQSALDGLTMCTSLTSE